MPARHHLTIAEKNTLRAFHRERPDLTQEQLREWTHERFGKWVGRSTIGKVASMPEEVCANPSAKRNQTGRYPDMERELYRFIVSTVRQNQNQMDEALLRDELPVLSEAVLWTKANEILKRLRGDDQSVSVGWVQRFKKRHGLHRSQRVLRLQQSADESVEAPEAEAPEAAVAITTPVAAETSSETGASMAQEQSAGDESAEVEVLASEQATVDGDGSAKRAREGEETDDEKELSPPHKKAATSPQSGRINRKQFSSAADIELLTEVLATKPWAFTPEMDGWQHVALNLRDVGDYRLDKTAGACQARVALLLEHLRAGNTAALHKSGMEDEFARKQELLTEVQQKITASTGFAVDVHQRSNEMALPPSVTQETAVTQVADTSNVVAATETSVGHDHDAERRLELLERKMERELAEQRRHADEQVRQLERLQRTQLETQQTQHAQLLATIQQQQAMMLDLIKSVSSIQQAQAKKQE
ncbi:hypothetical protein PHYBOEH_009247 [Phytophthora boehmeriae]|uniref:HTH CENPB-type domain-containing protein n=1 Tax=Phytophthora boehmeriae TaxID=109152 RepID=A0A8T1VZD3_9STRA|nr:hypothetical protein PHYBOEH_009247 [Phytophthora boehmeriae]